MTRCQRADYPRWVFHFCFVVPWLLLAGCTGAISWQDDVPQEVSRQSAPVEISSEALPDGELVTLSDQLTEYYASWSGVPYLFGGDSRSGIDCSAYVQQAMRSVLGINLPRTTEQQMLQGQPIEPELAISGDLVFFNTGPGVKHVGILIGSNKFMHASQNRGVTISRLDDRYWSARLSAFRRVSGFSYP